MTLCHFIDWPIWRHLRWPMSSSSSKIYLWIGYPINFNKASILLWDCSGGCWRGLLCHLSYERILSSQLRFCENTFCCKHVMMIKPSLNYRQINNGGTHIRGWKVCNQNTTYFSTSIMSATVVGNKIIDHSAVDGTSPVSAAPTTSVFATKHRASMDWARQLQSETKNIYVWWYGAAHTRGFTVFVLRKYSNCFSECAWSPRKISGKWVLDYVCSIRKLLPRALLVRRWWFPLHKLWAQSANLVS